MITMVATKEKKFVQIEIGDDVKKLTIEGVDKDQQVVMRQELNEDELDNVAGGPRIIPELISEHLDACHSLRY